MPSVYQEDNFSGRVNYAAQCFMRNIGSTRHFDTCFEMYDGDVVVTALVRRCEKNHRLKAAIASQFSGTFPLSWIEVAEENKDVPTRKLRDLATRMRREAQLRYATKAA